MDAIHSLWSKPNISKNAPIMQDFEILTAILSALKWKQKNGSISMITDSYGADFLYSLGISDIWDNIDTQLDLIPQSIDENAFWAGGKIFALSCCNSPIVSLDTDFIVWDTLNFPENSAAIHKENLNEVYPNLPDFLEFGYDLDFEVLPCNTAFIYINNNDFLKLYTRKAIEFMNKFPVNSLSYMLFAEQRLFSMCAKKLNLKISEFMMLDKLLSSENKSFTHLWGDKNRFKHNKKEKNIFIQKLFNRLNTDFPERSDIFFKLKNGLEF